LGSIDADALETLTLRLREGSALLHSHWDVVGIWHAHQDTRTPWPEEIAHPSRCLICRPQWRAEVMPLSLGEHAALLTISNGASLGAALEAASDAEPAFDPTAALPRWLQAGAFSTLSSMAEKRKTQG
jgi:hypothetical protein